MRNNASVGASVNVIVAAFLFLFLRRCGVVCNNAVPVGRPVVNGEFITVALTGAESVTNLPKHITSHSVRREGRLLPLAAHATLVGGPPNCIPRLVSSGVVCGVVGIYL